MNESTARKAGRTLRVRQAAARAAVTASKKTGRPVDDRVRALAQRLPEPPAA